MKKLLLLFLQIAVVIIGLLTVFVLIRLPQTEGRAQNLDLWSIYSDPFILYGYLTSLPFFLGLKYTFVLLGNIRKNELLSITSITLLQKIKFSAIVFGVMVSLAGLYIKLFHAKEDDSAGFLALCFLVVLVSLLVSIMAILSKRFVLRNIDTKID